jgi:ABC-type uncharacterized transport system substrate-binding protein
MTDAEKLAKALDALEGLFAMVEKKPSPLITADERFVIAGAVLGEFRPKVK